jgi:hypothetical protein
MGDELGERRSEAAPVRELLSDAIRYWEPRRAACLPLWC